MNRFLFTGTTGGNKTAGGWRYIRDTRSVFLSLSANTWEMPLKPQPCTASHLVAALDQLRAQEQSHSEVKKVTLSPSLRTFQSVFGFKLATFQWIIPPAVAHCVSACSLLSYSSPSHFQCGCSLFFLIFAGRGVLWSRYCSVEEHQMCPPPPSPPYQMHLANTLYLYAYVFIAVLPSSYLNGIFAQ